VHCHVDYLGLAFTPFVTTPLVTTMHGQLDLPYLRPFCRRFPRANVVSISNHQRTPLADLQLNWAGTVYNGVPVETFPFRATPGGYLLFVGRLSPEKRVDWAVEIARRAGMPLKIAAKINVWEQDYYEDVLKPLFNDPLVEFVGEVNEAEKRALMADAYALVFPIDWPEPFGMVMIEALACGTPVLALNRGAVPEVLRHEVTGFIGANVDELVAAVPRVAELDRARCRADVARRFGAETMAEQYVKVYTQLIARQQRKVYRRTLQRSGKRLNC
jgi:glycosyltransferase involved in cell wall biosynthesis